jgi:hypothetical protein
MEFNYPESWARQKPKGYESSIYIATNDGLALKVFQEFCCDGCSCKSEKDHNKK